MGYWFVVRTFMCYSRVPTLPGKPVFFFSRPGKCLEFAWKVVKHGILTQNLEKNLKFANFMFQASLFKMSFTKIILIYFLVISILSTHILIRSQSDLGFHCFYLEINWKINGILCHKRNWKPASVLTHFKIFINKICMKVPGIWHKQTWTILEFRTKNLEKTWNLVFGKTWEPCTGFNGNNQLLLFNVVNSYLSFCCVSRKLPPLNCCYAKW